MALPLLNYKPTTQNVRVRSFGIADEDEDTPYIYRMEDSNSPAEVLDLINAIYRQLFSEHAVLQVNRQKNLESQLKNKTITVRDFVRGIAKSPAFYNLVVESNNNYRLVEVTLKRFLGRAPYNKDEEIAWSIKIGTLGYYGFVDALIDSEEYTQAFGDYTVPYQRKRMEGRPINLVTPATAKTTAKLLVRLRMTGALRWRKSTAANTKSDNWQKAILASIAIWQQRSIPSVTTRLVSQHLTWIS
jgi:phycobilisome rod-core linker protein